MTQSPDAGSPPAPTVPVFDIGGVLIDWNPRYLYRKLFDDAAEMEAFLADVCSPAWNLSLDGGKSFAEGVAELTARFPEHEALIRAYDERWPEMVPNIFDDTVAMLERLKDQGPVYAITNFSREKFALARELWPFLNSFDGVVVSGEVGLLKPHPEIFMKLIGDYDLDARECVFIDDVPANVEGARAVGMQAVHFRTPKLLRADLEAVGML